MPEYAIKYLRYFGEDRRFDLAIFPASDPDDAMGCFWQMINWRHGFQDRAHRAVYVETITIYGETDNDAGR